MSDPDRYRDRREAEPPLTMDGRRPRPRERGPAPVTLIVSLLLLAGVAGGGFYLYRSGVRGAGEGSQALGAPLGDVRAPAPPQAQTPDPGAGLSISKDDPNTMVAPPTLAPAPEQPLPPTAKPRVAAPAPAPVQTAAAPPPPPPLDDEDTAKPAAKPAAKAVAAKGDAIDALIAKADKPKATTALASGGPVIIQIGAFSSTNLADKEWNKAAAVAPGAMAGKGKRVVAVTRDDGATLYRTAITGFASRDQAMALCDKLKAAGGSCFVR